MLSTQCEALSAALTAKVSYPTSSVYNSSLLSYWSAQEERISPNCIVSPTSSQDVALVVKILTENVNLTGAFSDQTTGCNFAIRSGGHTAHAGSANIDDGVTVDLRALNDVTVSEDKATVTIGPGQKWENIYAALDPLGLSVPGVRVGEVGVGGSTLGGQLYYPYT